MCVFLSKWQMMFFVALCGLHVQAALAKSQNIDGTFLVDVEVNGVPAVFMLDTGAERTVLDWKFAQQCGLRAVGAVDIQRPYSSGEADVVLVTSLNLGAVQHNSLEVMTDHLEAISAALGKHIDGVLGNDVLRNSVITLNYSSGLVTFGRLISKTQGFSTKLHRVGDLYSIFVEDKNVSLNFLLDTGTNFSAISQNSWSKLGLDKASLVNGIRSSGASAASLGCMHNVKIGRLSYQNLPMRVLPTMHSGLFSRPDIDGILGSDFLRHFKVSFDLKNEVLYLSRDFNVTSDFERFSTIGIQFMKDSSGFYVVMAVWEPTPASEAGIKVGDLLLSVNGSSTTEMTEEDLSRQLHGTPGREVQLDIRSGVTTRSIRLLIRNLLCHSTN